MMDSNHVLDLLGNLITQLKGYAARLPAVVHLNMLPGGLKPKPEAVETYEQTLSRFRGQAGGTPYRRLTPLFMDSLEAFEAGNLLGTVQPLLAVLDHLEQMARDKDILMSPADTKRMAEYRAHLHKILPGNEPELEGAGKGMV
ncbi:hypothetical protein DNFV4_00593 [Nitrospira tepida]|uniref:Uncharacterized protein n=1 Tax=Nitrospira tepida TaxID=2973512 RepID=A0AA86MW72_9BACT|nr:hypothetical protein [Nitrospira tepida]CAI4030168.1 hypothetical protein DNFV4_00593 [Nitrospira tepida]